MKKGLKKIVAIFAGLAVTVIAAALVLVVYLAIAFAVEAVIPFYGLQLVLQVAFGVVACLGGFWAIAEGEMVREKVLA